MGLLLGCWPQSSQLRCVEHVTVEARPRSISVGDSVRLTVQAVTQDQGTLEAPDIEDWDVVSQSQQTSLSYGSGGQKKISIIELSLQPNKVGTLSIKPFVLKSKGKTYRSQTIPIAVTGSQNPPPMPRSSQSTSPAPSQTALESWSASEHTGRSGFLVWEVNRDTVWLGSTLMPDYASITEMVYG